MSRNNNFLDADESLREQNLRFVRNDLEDDLQQFFGGESNNSIYPSSNSIHAPPRDYKIVTPKPVPDSRNCRPQAPYEYYSNARHDQPPTPPRQLNWCSNNTTPYSHDSPPYYGYSRDFRDSTWAHALQTSIQNVNPTLNMRPIQQRAEEEATPKQAKPAFKGYATIATTVKKINNFGKKTICSIYDDSQPGGKICLQHERVIETAIKNALATFIVNSHVPILVQRTWFQNGVYKLIALSRNTSKTLQNIVRALPSPWTGAKLRFELESNRFAESTKVNVFLNSTNAPTEEIFTILERQNNGLHVKLWRCIRRHNTEKGTFLLLAVDKRSYVTLLKSNGSMFFLTSKVTFKSGRKPVGVIGKTSAVGNPAWTGEAAKLSQNSKQQKLRFIAKKQSPASATIVYKSTQNSNITISSNSTANEQSSSSMMPTASKTCNRNRSRKDKLTTVSSVSGAEEKPTQQLNTWRGKTVNTNCNTAKKDRSKSSQTNNNSDDRSASSTSVHSAVPQINRQNKAIRTQQILAGQAIKYGLAPNANKMNDSRRLANDGRTNTTPTKTNDRERAAAIETTTVPVESSTKQDSAFRSDGNADATMNPKNFVPLPIDDDVVFIENMEMETIIVLSSDDECDIDVKTDKSLKDTPQQLFL